LVCQKAKRKSVPVLEHVPEIRTQFQFSFSQIEIDDSNPPNWVTLNIGGSHLIVDSFDRLKVDSGLGLSYMFASIQRWAQIYVSHIIIHPYAIDTLPSPLEGGLCMVALLGIQSQDHCNLSLLTS